MHTPEERDKLRETLISEARADERITSAALTGSAARDAEDPWSDIDLAFGLAADADITQTIADWTERMYSDHASVTHMDVVRGATVYRVFLIASTLQVDIAFSPAAEFGAIAPTFRLIFGTAEEQPSAVGPDAPTLIGLAWLYALHARSSIARGRVWQAEYMISGVRDHVMSLACLRHGLPPTQGHGMDNLPAELTATMTGALVSSLGISELVRAFRVVTDALIVEISHVDPALCDRLVKPLRELAG